MSASNTNLDKQARRHRGPLVGIALAVGFAVVLFAGLLAWTSHQSDNPNAASPAEVIAD